MNKKIYIGLGALMLATSGLLIWNLYGSRESHDATQNQAQPPKKEASINGLLVIPDLAQRRPIAVMIENHPDSRPQSGLAAADIVYETLAEGGITRYLAIYQTAEAAEFGPIRSARPYFLELASEYQAVFAHVGGSDEALADISSGKYAGLDDADEFYLGDYFSRINTRPAPHNTYSSLERIRELILDKNWQQKSEIQVWSFSDQAIGSGQLASEISLNFSTPTYRANFLYDAATGVYKRSLAGEADVDKETNQQLTSTTIIAQLVDVKDIPGDPKLRVNIDLSSGGTAKIFYGGQVIDATWTKQNNPDALVGAGRTRYYDATGNEVVFPRGKIWIGLIPDIVNSVIYK